MATDIKRFRKLAKASSVSTGEWRKLCGLSLGGVMGIRTGIPVTRTPLGAGDTGLFHGMVGVCSKPLEIHCLWGRGPGTRDG